MIGLRANSAKIKAWLKISRGEKKKLTGIARRDSLMRGY